MARRKPISKNFAAGESQTEAIQLNEQFTLTGITITGSKISGSLMTFLVSDDGTNYYPLYDSSSAEVSLTTTTEARSYALYPFSFLSWNFVKGRLGTTGSPVLQATVDQEIIFNCKTIE
jgi:hypothetical protein